MCENGNKSERSERQTSGNGGIPQSFQQSGKTEEPVAAPVVSATQLVRSDVAKHQTARASHTRGPLSAARRRQRRVDHGGGRADTAWCSDDGGGGSSGDSVDGGNCHHRRLEVGAVHRRAWRSSIAVRRRGRRWSPPPHGGGPPEPGQEVARAGHDTAADPALWPLARAHVTGHVVVSYKGRRAKRPGQWHGKHEAKKKSI